MDPDPDLYWSPTSYSGSGSGTGKNEYGSSTLVLGLKYGNATDERVIFVKKKLFPFPLATGS